MDIHKQEKGIWIAMPPGSRRDNVAARLGKMKFNGACHPGFPKDLSENNQSDHPKIVVADMALTGGMTALEHAGMLWEQWFIPTLFLVGPKDMADLTPEEYNPVFRIISDSCSDIELKLNLELGIHAAHMEKERQKRFKELETESAWLKMLVEESRDAIVVVDKQGRVHDANQTFAKVLGYTMEELFDLSVWDWDARLSKSDILEKLKNVDMSGDLFETLHLRKDGSIFDTEISTKAAMWKGRKMVCCTCRQITERIQYQNKLQESQARLAALSDASFESIFLSDQGVCLDQNLTAQRMFGYSRDEAVGRSGMEWIQSADRETVRHNILSGYEKPYEVTALRKDGTTFPAEIQGRMFMAFGRRIRSTAVRDISERKRIEEEKIQALDQVADASKLALVGQVAGKMAHDFNNILGIMMGHVELSLLECRDPEIRKTLELVIEQTHRGKNLTRNLVAFANAQEPRQEFFPVDQKIEQTLTLLKMDLEGIYLIRDYVETAPDLFADSGMIEHALVNVLQNAIHALSLSTQPTILIKTYDKGGYLWIKIEDNGCGIPEDFLGRIFEPAFTLKGSRDKTRAYKEGIKGTGYGMANVKKYVSQHHGLIEVHSTLGQGTRVEMAFPVIEKNLTPKEVQEIEAQNFCSGKSILLVEDEASIADLQFRILTRPPCNHQVDLADTGLNAMELFDRNFYDIISLDYMLPGGINGMDVYHYIRKKTPDIPILFISGNIEFLESIRDLTQKDAWVDHLSKPCRNMDYLHSVHRLLNRAEASKK
ncbi:PAS domain S-box protein [uncultured Desulfobacter sp.]|uniref:PAS domain-containing hybrid sensor histidine kinase/response regulator n=1 Tax=uncultured Desulfobacter sp. TaxID=240139 RepID=UPI002AAB186B|nr:PAS domain S-box protein [uncultured Desulfobacter sp.]